MIIFENKGELDIRAVKTMGVNSKENPGSAIGYFGTGLKYALAILLRHNHRVTIHTGGELYTFGTIKAEIRNDIFDIVTMNGEELGFTTDLGKNWEMWMAFREIYSNMLDENGEAHESGFPQIVEGNTYVTVQGNQFEECYRDRDKYFLNRSVFKPLQKHREVDIYEKLDPREPLGSIFYKGVRVMETRLTALFDYNHHTGLTLTEDRTIKDSWSTLWHVASLVTSSQDKAFIKRMVMTGDEQVYEDRINFRMNSNDNCDVFLDVVGELRKKYKDKGINHTAIELHKQQRKVTKVMPGISCHLNKVQEQQLKKAVDFCSNTLELELDEYQLIVCKDIADDLGRADMEAGIMYISKKCFDQGTKRVAVAILEEYTHCHHEVKDETVEQKWVYLEQIISLGERMEGEPL